MRIVCAYLLRGFALRAAIALIALTAIYLAFDLGDLGRRLAQVVGWPVVLRAALLHAPLIVVQILPVALFISCVMFLASLRLRGELGALAALGGGPAALVLPLVLAGTAATLGAFALGEWVVPPCEAAADARYGRARPSALTGTVVDRGRAVWARRGRWFVQRTGRRVLALALDPSLHRVERRVEGRVACADDRPTRGGGGGQTRVLCDALDWRLGGEAFARTRRPKLALPALAALSSGGRAMRIEAQSLAQLSRGIAARRATGRSARLQTLVLHTKLSYPLANLLLALLALSFARGTRRRSAARDLALAAAALIGLWTLIAGGWLLGRTGAIAPAAAGWAPLGIATALTGAASAVAFRRPPAG